MKLDDETIARRNLYSAHEDEAGGVLAGVSASPVPGELLKRDELEALRRETDTILDSVGVKPSLVVVETPAPVSYEAKLAFLRDKLTDSANVVLLAARGFSSLPPELVETLYDEVIELDQRASARKS